METGPTTISRKKLSDRLCVPFLKEGKGLNWPLIFLKGYVLFWPILFGALFSIFPSLGVNTRLCFTPHEKGSYGVDVWAWVIWAITILWLLAILLFDAVKKREINNARAKRKEENVEDLEGIKTHYTSKINELTKKIEGLDSTIANAPTKGIFVAFKYISEEVLGDLQTLDKQLQTPDLTVESKIETFEKNFEPIFGKIYDLTSTFCLKEEASYCINIMHYVPANTDPSSYYSKILADKSNRIYFENTPAEKILGLLYNIKALTIKFGDGFSVDRGRTILPILSNNEAKVIPGAPHAAWKGDTLIYKIDVENGKEFALLTRELKEEAVKYFNGPGQNIQSIVSLRIPSTEISKNKKQLSLAGVLNIDCDKEDILGGEDKYFATYCSLVKPLICQLAPYFHKYFELIQNKNA